MSVHSCGPGPSSIGCFRIFGPASGANRSTHLVGDMPLIPSLDRDRKLVASRLRIGWTGWEHRRNRGACIRVARHSIPPNQVSDWIPMRLICLSLSIPIVVPSLYLLDSGSRYKVVLLHGPPSVVWKLGHNDSIESLSTKGQSSTTPNDFVRVQIGTRNESG